MELLNVQESPKQGLQSLNNKDFGSVKKLCI